MEIPTVSTYGTKTSQHFTINGGDTPVTTLMNRSTHTGSATPIIHGDGKNPNPWAFNVTQDYSINGMTRRSNTTGTQYTLETGVLATSSGITSISTQIQSASDSAYRDAIEEFYNKLSGKVDAATNTGEGGYKSGVQRTLQAADDARRQAGRWGVGSIGRAWLSLQYMWLPAMGDIYNLTQAAAGQMTRNGFIVTGQGSKTESFDPQSLVLDGFSYGRIPIGGQVEARVKIKGRFVVNKWLDLAHQLTTLDPLVIGWNMLPYSFVVDWFYNVGGYLGALESAAMYNSAYVPKGGFVTFSHTADANISYYGKSTDGSVTAHLNAQTRKIASSRTVMNGLPLPIKPAFKVDLGSGTLLNAAALLASKLDVDFLQKNNHLPGKWKRFI